MFLLNFENFKIMIYIILNWKFTLKKSDYKIALYSYEVEKIN